MGLGFVLLETLPAHVGFGQSATMPPNTMQEVLQGQAL